MPTRRRAWFAICFALVLAGCLALSALQVQAGPQPQAGCNEWIANGGFEVGGPLGIPGPIPGWTFGAAPAQPQRVNSIVHTGQWSLLLGIPQGYPNQRSYSSAQQPVAIPAGATSAVLSFWYDAMMPGAPATDYVELALLAPDGHSIIDKPWRGFVDNRAWNQVRFDLTGWRGQTVVLYFNVFNDGAGSPATMFLDDVSLQVCGSGIVPGTWTPTPTAGVLATSTPTVLPPATATGTRTATPTPTFTLPPLATWTPTPTFTLPPYNLPTTPVPPPQTLPPVLPPAGTPLPPPAGGCVDLVQNGGFETGVLDPWWDIAPNKIPVAIESSAVFAGSYALQLGTFVPANVASYSSIRQLVTIPAGYVQVVLEFATWTYMAAPAGADRMEVDFLEPDPAVLGKFWRVQAIDPGSNDQAWRIHQVDVTNFRGRSVLLYANVYNDGAGGAAAMLLDEVHIWACPSTFEISPIAIPGNLTVPVRQQARADVTVTPAPGMTVLALSSNTPEPPRGPQATAARATPAPTLTPTPQPNLLTRIGQALHLPPLPAYWPLGLLAILVVLFLLLLLLRNLWI